MSTSGAREASIRALPRIRLRDNLPKSWPVASLSSEPLLLASADASCFTCLMAVVSKPPRVSMAKGMNTRPSARQASAVSLFFLAQAFPVTNCVQLDFDLKDVFPSFLFLILLFLDPLYLVIPNRRFNKIPESY